MNTKAVTYGFLGVVALATALGLWLVWDAWGAIGVFVFALLWTFVALIIDRFFVSS